MLTEATARWLLVLHTVLGVAAVGAATHLVIWLRRAARGGAIRGARRFAWLTLALQAGAFVAGVVMYPTYKIEVRAAYLENAPVVASDATARHAEVARLAAREGLPAPVAAPTAERVRLAARAARWFDVKEHWVALGLIACAALVLVVMLWDPRRDGRALAPVIGALAVTVAGTLWLGAIIGLVTASWRAV